MDFTADALARCARREVAQRKRVYPRLVSDGRLSRDKAALEIDMMVAIAEHFERLHQPGLEL